MRSLTLCALLTLAACSSRPVLHRTAAPPPEPSAAERIAGWRATAGDAPELASALDALLAVETERRCDAYLAAGAAAWRAERRDLAADLWRTALDCRPSEPRRLAIDDDAALLAFPLITRLAPDREPAGSGALRDVGEAHAFIIGARRAPGADSPFVEQLMTALDLEQPTLTLVRHGRALSVAPPANISAIDDALRRLAAAQNGWVISVEATFLATPDAGLDDGLRALFALREPRALTDAERARVDPLVTRQGRLAAPRVVALPGQQAHISLLNQTSYIRDYRVERQAEATVLDPQVGVVFDGLVVELRGVRLDDGSVLLQLTTHLARLRRIARVDTELAGKPVQIGIPEVTRLGRDCALRLDGDALAWIPLGTLPDDDGDPIAYAVVARAHAIPAPEATRAHNAESEPR